MKFLIILVFILTSIFSYAKDNTLNLKQSLNSNKTQFKYLDDIMAKASPDDLKNMEKVLMQLSFAPSHKDPTSGTQLFKVTMVEKGSIFEKAGLKVGDLIANGKSPNK